MNKITNEGAVKKGLGPKHSDQRNFYELQTGPFTEQAQKKKVKKEQR
jgi:hypothetical protein